MDAEATTSRIRVIFFDLGNPQNSRSPGLEKHCRFDAGGRPRLFQSLDTIDFSSCREGQCVTVRR
jgi:hypothetical protein